MEKIKDRVTNGGGFVGVIIDIMRPLDLIVGRTREHNTWEAAQHAIEKQAKRKGLYKSDRYSFEVI